MKTVTISSDEPWKLLDASGALQQLEPGRVVLGPTLKPRLPASAAPTQLSQPVTFLPGKAPLKLAGKPYRGTVQVSAAKGKVQAVNVVPLEGYLKGVVPSEMPSGWAAEALKAQAVAARSYALASRTPNAPFDVYGDVRSQVYLGLAAESPAASAAVDATKGQVVLSAGKVATTFFFSTSGGRTAAPGEVFKGPTFPPYLVSVADPYDTASPYHDWGPTPVDVTAAGKKLGLAGRLTDLALELWPSGRVKKATATGLGTSVTVTGPQLRSLLGLRSTWLSAGLMTLERPYGPVTYGNAVKITGRARGAGSVTVEQRIGTPFWSPAPPIQPDAGGAFAFTVKPTASTDFRLVAGTIKAPALKVPVAPLVLLAAPTDLTLLSGTTKPVIPGAAVQIQRLDGIVWTDVGEGVVDIQGAFTATLDVLPGTYRARYAPGNGLVAGLSPPQVVS
jgi:stage II sporulation protein D